MKYIVTLYKGENFIISQEEFFFVGKAKKEKRDSVFIQNRLIGMGNIADVSPIKEDYIPDQLFISEKTEGTALTKERFKELDILLKEKLKKYNILDL